MQEDLLHEQNDFLDLEDISAGLDDDALIANLTNVIRGVACVIGQNCEVVLHSLKNLDKSVIAIENGHVTGRNIGSPMTDLALSVLKKSYSLDNDVIGSYYSSPKEGQRLKSVTILIRNTASEPIAMLCINIDISLPLDSFMKSFLEMSLPSAKSKQLHERYPTTIEELVKQSLLEVQESVSKRKGMSSTEKNRKVITELNKRGIFNVRDAMEIVSTELGISKYTIYNYLRALKQ